MEVTRDKKQIVKTVSERIIGENLLAQLRQSLVCEWDEEILASFGSLEIVFNYGVSCINTGYEIYTDILREISFIIIKEKYKYNDTKYGYQKVKRSMNSVQMQKNAIQHCIDKK